MDRIRTEYDKLKILEKNENLRGQISNKDLIIKMLSEILSKIINCFNKSNSTKSRGSTENNVDRKTFQFSQEKSFIQPKKTAKASNNNALVNSANYEL